MSLKITTGLANREGSRLRLSVCDIADASSVHTQRWAGYFVRPGCVVTVISPRYGEIPGAKVIVFASNRHGLMRLAEALICAIRLRRLLRRLKPDIVHVHYIYNRAFPLNLAFWKVKNLIASTWGQDVVAYTLRERLNQTFFKRFILKQARLITATSHYLARETAKYAPPNKEVHVIPWGVDEEIFIPSSKVNSMEDRMVTLGLVKSLEPTYGPEYLIQVMALVVARYPTARLVMAGKGAMEEELKRMVLNLKIEQSISFVGFVPHEEIPALLQSIDIFVMPSCFETFGVAAVEAQATELPVVATRVGGIPEVVVDGVTGILVEPRNPEQLAEAILKLIEDPELRLRMGQEGRRYVLKHYRWVDNAAEMAKLYRQYIHSIVKVGVTGLNEE